MKELRDFSELGLITVTPDDVNNHQGRKLHTKFLSLEITSLSCLPTRGYKSANTRVEQTKEETRAPRCTPDLGLERWEIFIASQIQPDIEDGIQYQGQPIYRNILRSNEVRRLPIGYTYVAWPRDDRERTLVNWRGILDKGCRRDVEKRSEERGQASQGGRKEGEESQLAGHDLDRPVVEWMQAIRLSHIH